jgi:endonuclease/exonuclease/phosphatase family metal-dependent hydrolase
LTLFVVVSSHGAETFRIVTFNLQNYLAVPSGSRPAKTEAAKAQVRNSIRLLKPDVLALQEIGGAAELGELRDALRSEGLQFSASELVAGPDTNIHVAVLSRFPIIASRPHSNEAFIVFGKQYQVRRGFAEVDIQVNSNYVFTLLTAHLKSKLSAFEVDEGDLREEEAKLLRRRVDAILESRPKANVIVLGDLNDTQDSRAVRTVIGRKNALVDTRPVERNGDDQPNSNPHYPPPRIAWTHYYGKEDSYRRIDYILLSQGMAREWLPDESTVLNIPNWGVASDHRPIVAAFTAEDR